MNFFVKNRLLCFLSISVALSIGENSASDTQKKLMQCRKRLHEEEKNFAAIVGSKDVIGLWNVLFNDLDLNGNGKVSASEMVLKLYNNKEHSSAFLTHFIRIAQDWINILSPHSSDNEIELKTLLEKVVKDAKRAENSEEKIEVVRDIQLSFCEYTVQKLPDTSHAIQLLQNCAGELKRDQLKAIVANKKELIADAWRTVFAEMDGDGDGYLRPSELRKSYFQFHQHENVSGKDVKTDTNVLGWDIKWNRRRYFKELLTTTLDAQNWKNLTSISQVKGKQQFCSTLRSLFKTIRLWIRKNLECIDLFQITAQRVLGTHHKSLAEGYIYAMADSNKDGNVTEPELNEFVNAKRKLTFYVPAKSHAMFRQINHGMFQGKAPNSSNYPNFFQMSLQGHKNWNLFCVTSIQKISEFPGSPGYNKTPSVLKMLEIIGTKIHTGFIPSKPELVKLQILEDEIRKMTNHQENKRIEKQRIHDEETESEAELRDLLEEQTQRNE